MAESKGKIFEHNIQKSAEEQGIFVTRLKDVHLPPSVRTKIHLPHNPYDFLMFYKEHLFPLEFKSTKAKSISFSPKIIRPWQIENLKKATQYDDVIPGFIFNFREPNNVAYFVHIDDFLTYKKVAIGDIENTYEAKINRSSIPVGIVEEIGTKIFSVKLRTNYRYYLKKLFDELIEKDKHRTKS